MAALLAVLTAAAVPQALASLNHDRAVIAAHYISSRMSLARMEAVRRSTNVAVRFEEGAATTMLASFADGNHDGVRTKEIADRTDPALDAALSLSSLFPGVIVALDADSSGSAVPRPGVTTLLSFTPVGTASTGSVYITGKDGSRYVVRVLGATARTRILRFDPRRGRWVDVF